MAGRNYGTDPYGIIARGDPSPRGGGASFDVGRVGNAVRDYSSPDRSFGSGIGGKVIIPVKTSSKAKGGVAKKSGGGCSVKAYGDMIKKAAGGKVQTSADTARKLATEMGGMKKGGKPKNGLAFGVGKPVKEKATGERYASKAAMAKHEAAESPMMERAERRVKKMDGGTPLDMAASKASRGMMSVGGKPVKKARGGAGKVRKGMMSSSGDMLQPVKPKAGLGSSY